MATKAQTPVTCELCESDIDVKFYCVTCGLVLCLKCKKAHTRIPRTKNDEIISLSEARKQKKCKPTVTLCNDHPTEEISLFCEQCGLFICSECLVENHQGHQLTKWKKKIGIKKEEITKFLTEIQNKKEVLKKALDTENNVHATNTQCYDQIRTDISEHVKKIIEEFTSLRDEKFTELSTLQKKENERHSDACTNIQSQSETLTAAMELVQTAINSENPVTMETANHDASKLVQNVGVTPEPMKAVTKYTPGNIKRPVMMPVFGDILTEDRGARPKQQHPDKSSAVSPMFGDMLKEDQGARAKQQRPENLGKPRPPDVIQRQRKIDINKVKITSTIQGRDTGYSIRVMVPVTQDTAWVAVGMDKNLTLINRDGATVRTSVQLCDSDSFIIDAKQYNNDLLVTCWKQQEVTRLTEDGGTKTTFTDVSPYYTYGLCVTHVMDILLCLKSTLRGNDHDAKVIRLNSNGDRIQSIQRDDKGDLLYSWPYRVTSLQSGEVIVCDRDQHMRVSCVKSEDHLMFTWSGKVQGKKKDKFDPWCITHDWYNNLFITDKNNHRVCVLSKDGTEAMCLVDNKQGIQYPHGMAVDERGQLWVGCDKGKIYIIEY